MIPVIQVQGKIVDPSAGGVQGGSITYRLPVVGMVSDAGDELVVTPVHTTPIGLDGTVNFGIIPNTEITPTGTAYWIEYVLSCGVKYREIWQVDGAGSNPIDIGEIPRIGSPPGITTLALGGLSDVLLTNPQNGEVIVYDNGIWKNAAGGGGASTLASLTDTDLVSLTEFDYLVYDNASGDWLNRALTLPPFTAATLPAESAANVRKIVVQKDPGTPSQVKICLEDSNGSFGWWVLLGTP